MAIFPWDVQAKSYCLECQSLVKAKQKLIQCQINSKNVWGGPGVYGSVPLKGKWLEIDDEGNPASNSTV